MVIWTVPSARGMLERNIHDRAGIFAIDKKFRVAPPWIVPSEFGGLAEYLELGFEAGVDPPIQPLEENAFACSSLNEMRPS